MKKLINLLIYLLIFNILLCLTLLLDIYSNKNDITQTAIEISISSNDNYNLIEQILKDTNKKDLIEFIDYIKLDIDQSIENDNSNYTSFTITLPQNKSFIALYKKNNDNTYTFCSLIDSLCEVENFYFYSNFFVVEQYIKNSASSEGNKQFVEVFFNHGNTYIPVFIKDTYIELNTSDKKDYKAVISSSIDFLDAEKIKVLYVSTYKIINTQNKIGANIEANDKSGKVIKEVYEWNDRLNTFELVNKETIHNE